MKAYSRNSPEPAPVNAALNRLGFGVRDRVTVIHADDIGMCEGTVPALEDLLDFGLVSSAAVMVPCPGFPAAAEWSRLHPEADIGIHITLTSEWEHYRWGPVAVPAVDSGLLDDMGFLPLTVAQLRRRAKTGAVLREARAQLALARQSGMQPSHMDSHMFALKRAFRAAYFQLICETGVPALIERHEMELWRKAGRDVAQIERAGFPVFDHLRSMPDKGAPEDRIAEAKELFSQLPPGLSCILLHPARETPELRSIVPHWRSRVADWKAFQNRSLQKHLLALGIQVVTYRALAAR